MPMLIDPVTPDTANAEQRAAFDAARQRFGRDIAPVGVAARHPEILSAVGRFEAALGRAGRLPARLKHLVNLKAAALLGCPFCIDIGTHIARSDGITAATVADLPGYRNSAEFTPVERAALDAAEAMTVGNGHLDDALAERLRSHFDAAQLVELLAVIAWENYRSRFNLAAGLEATGFCPLAQRAADESAIAQRPATPAAV